MQGPKEKKIKIAYDENHEYRMSSEELQKLNPTIFATVQEFNTDVTPQPSNFNDFYCYNNPECYDCSLMENTLEALEVLNECYGDVDNTCCFDYMFDD